MTGEGSISSDAQSGEQLGGCPGTVPYFHARFSRVTEAILFLLCQNRWSFAVDLPNTRVIGIDLTQWITPKPHTYLASSNLTAAGRRSRESLGRGPCRRSNCSNTYSAANIYGGSGSDALAPGPEATPRPDRRCRMSPRRSTPAAARSATSRRPSRTWPWSRQPSTCNISSQSVRAQSSEIRRLVSSSTPVGFGDRRYPSRPSPLCARIVMV